MDRLHLAIVDFYLDISVNNRLKRYNLEEAHHYSAVAEMLMSLPSHPEQMKKAPPTLRLRKQVAKFIGYLFFNSNSSCPRRNGNLENHDYINANGHCCEKCQLLGYIEAERLMGFAIKAGALEHEDSMKVLTELKTQICLLEPFRGYPSYLSSLEKYFDSADFEGEEKQLLDNRKMQLRRCNGQSALLEIQTNTFNNQSFEKLCLQFLSTIYGTLDPPSIFEWSNTPYGVPNEEHAVKVNPFLGQVLGAKDLKNLIEKRPFNSQPVMTKSTLANMESSNEMFQKIVQDPLPSVMREISKVNNIQTSVLTGPNVKRSYIMKHDSAKRLESDDEEDENQHSISSNVSTKYEKTASSASVSPVSMSSGLVKKKRRYSQAEEDAIVEGYKIYGNSWETIRRRYNLFNRSGIDIKDKVRNLRKRGLIP